MGVACGVDVCMCVLDRQGHGSGVWCRCMYVCVLDRQGHGSVVSCRCMCVCWTGKAMGVACGVDVCVCVGQARPWEWRVV